MKNYKKAEYYLKFNNYFLINENIFSELLTCLKN